MPSAGAKVLNCAGGRLERRRIGALREEEEVGLHRVRMPQQLLALRRAAVSAHARKRYAVLGWVVGGVCVGVCVGVSVSVSVCVCVSVCEI